MSFRVIDVSVHQSEIDWKASKEAGVKAAMVRCGYSTDGPDTKFVYHARSVLACGMALGIYHYSYAKTIEEAAQEGEYCVHLIKDFKKDISFPVCYDIEEPRMQDYGKEKTTKMALAFLSKVKAAGYTPMVYCNTNWANNYIDIPALQKEGIKFWIAQYNSECQYDGTYSMWQYSSSTHLPGSNQNIDSSHCFEDFTGGKIDFKMNEQRGPNPKLEFRGTPDFDVLELQHNLNLSETKVADEELLNVLTQKEVALGSSGFLATWVQKRLVKLWFMKEHAINEAINAEVEKAIDAFHTYYNLQKGKISGMDWYYLLQP